MSDIQFRIANPNAVVGEILRVGVYWIGAPTIRTYRRREGPLGFWGVGLSFGWNADILGPPSADITGTCLERAMFPNLRINEFTGAVGPYRINQSEQDGRLTNDGDAQLACFAELWNFGDPLAAPSPDGTLLVNLHFPVLAAGDVELSWLEEPGESESTLDNCVIFGNAEPNVQIPATWHDLDVAIGLPVQVIPPEAMTIRERLQDVVVRMIDYGHTHAIGGDYAAFVAEISDNLLEVADLLEE